MRKTIMDVSRWQGVIDWNAVKASGKVDGVMIRALGSKGSKPYLDPQFEANYAGATAAGLPVGVYYYSTARTKAQADAELAALRKALAGKTLGLPVAVEDNKLHSLGKQALTDLTAYALGVIQSWGVYAMLYTGLYFGQTNLCMGDAALKPYDVWLAAYRKDKPVTAYPYGMWQYTSSGRVPGISGPVDLSHAYKDYVAIIQRKGLDKVKGA